MQRSLSIMLARTAHHTPGVAEDQLTLSQTSPPILTFGTDLDRQTSGMGHL